MISPGRDESKKYLKPPPSISCFTNLNFPEIAQNFPFYSLPFGGNRSCEVAWTKSKRMSNSNSTLCPTGSWTEKPGNANPTDLHLSWFPSTTQWYFISSKWYFIWYIYIINSGICQLVPAHIYSKWSNIMLTHQNPTAKPAHSSRLSTRKDLRRCRNTWRGGRQSPPKHL